MLHLVGYRIYEEKIVWDLNLSQMVLSIRQGKNKNLIVIIQFDKFELIQFSYDLKSIKLSTASHRKTLISSPAHKNIG